jgi:hypothetical protein
VLLVDLNADGRRDLVYADTTKDGVSVFVNNGGGSFGTIFTYPAGGSPQSVIASDLDGDGKVDFATTTAQGAVSVMINTSK